MQASVFDETQQIDFVCQDNDTATTALHRYLTENFASFKIQSYRSESKEPGRHAAAHATISIAANNEFFQGKAHDRDIESAALKALIDACNHLLIEQQFTAQSKKAVYAAVGLRDWVKRIY